jgi:glycosyltransferase involved in cell wall biosynthesis
MTLRILYDEQIFLRQRYGGISRYFVELASRIGRMPGCRAHVFAPLFINDYLRSEPSLNPFGIAIGGKGRKNYAPGARRIALALAPAYTRLVRPSAIHETYYLKGNERKRAPIVLTIYDMIHELFPETFPADDRTIELKRQAVARADQIICISEQTRDDLYRFCRIASGTRVSVVHLGGASGELTGQDETDIVRRPFFLYVGIRRGYKNFDRLAAALGASRTLRKDMTIVCYGGGSLLDSEKEMLIANGLGESQVIHIDGARPVLRALYTHATALVYPSLYEGFGLPPLEAMSFGCPVVCGMTGGIREVVADAALACDVSDTEELKIALERMAADSLLRHELAQRGMRRAMHFSWDKCAQETLALYNEIGRS